MAFPALPKNYLTNPKASAQLEPKSFHRLHNMNRRTSITLAHSCALAASLVANKLDRLSTVAITQRRATEAEKQAYATLTEDWQGFVNLAVLATGESHLVIPAR
jgi:hypothetical protein